MLLLNEETQTSAGLDRKHRERQLIEEGRILWQKQLEYAKAKRLEDQNQVREMIKYWPWGHHQNAKPRGLKNLRLEGLFSHQDYEKAKRTVGSLGIGGRPGGGAPNVNEAGKRLCRTREDPLLRFQWGKDCRRCVDNNLRYKKDRSEQHRYKMELDKLVEEKLKQKEKERFENAIKEKELGYVKDKKLYNDFKRMTLRPPNQITRNDKLLHPSRKCFERLPTKRTTIQLAPLRHDGKENGVELVPILLEKRTQMKIPLSTTDVTKQQGYSSGMSKWAMESSKYLQDLSNQMKYKTQHLQKIKLEDVEEAQRHFSTWDAFWGRPGHGAPRSAIKKTSIDKLLYPVIAA